ncbi:hypothetical protein GCM10023321_38830 [Pseudonocardia eucalypti]|uniref:Secreted protein n=1 Tax=Pseudonocardia eucalypti TaxID=648755 RepID=A0ABP9Q9Q8_9PSEU|nr:hypothetical protein [Pseudonocardia eucalypti]
MGLVAIVIAGAVILLIGFLAGARFEEHNLERRERALAQGRRRERELLARRARELEGRSGGEPERRALTAPTETR